MQELPDRLKVELREIMDALGLVNPQDEVFKLMIVLGLWAKYYQSIPDEIVQAGRQHHQQNEKMLHSLDGRLGSLQKLAQEVQQAVDQLDGAPSAIVECFPSEGLARSIAGKINEHFQKLPLLEVENSVRDLTVALTGFVETSRANHAETKGLFQKMHDEIKRLNGLAEDLKDTKFPNQRYLVRDICFLLIGFILCFVLSWIYRKT